MTRKTKTIELLAPAGGEESLASALHFGADAVYLGGKRYGLRSFACNFDLDELTAAVNTVHSHGKKVYLTANAAFTNRDFDGFEEYAAAVSGIGVDALIVSDAGVVRRLKKNFPDICIHLSTQANTMNYESALFWHELGVKRVILAREMSIADIAYLREKTPDTLELEAFVHGAMCISYSGRCLLSSVMANRSANAGECAQPCRWEYYLYEQGADGEYFPVFEDGRGTYLYNSRDLALIGHLKELWDAGVTSFKIEGRMKTAFYVATVVKAYRKAVDDMLAGKPFDEELKERLAVSATREFTTGFAFGNPMEQGQQIEKSPGTPVQHFLAAVLGYDEERGMLKIEQRNKFGVGDMLKVLSPDAEGTFAVTRMINEDGEEVNEAPHPKQILLIDCPFRLSAHDILMKA